MARNHSGKPSFTLLAENGSAPGGEAGRNSDAGGDFPPVEDGPDGWGRSCRERNHSGSLF
jgi:hypothetical protein